MQRWFNNFSTTLAAPLQITDTEASLAANPALDDGDFCYLTLSASVNGDIVREIVKLTRSGDDFTVDRAQDDTTAHFFVAGVIVENRWIAADAQQSARSTLPRQNWIATVSVSAP